MTALLCIGILVLSVAYNWVYAVCVRAMSNGQAHRAAIADTGLYLMSVVGLGALLLVGWWVIIPELVGQYLGTYLGTKYGSSREPAP